MDPLKLHIRLAGPGYESFTGLFGRHQFKDGRSVEEVPIRDALRYSAGTTVTDDAGNQLSPLTYRSDHNLSTVAAPVLTSVVEAPPPAGAVTPPPAMLHTREELEALADKEGINGLRKLADPHGIKGRSVADLIDALMKKQAE